MGMYICAWQETLPSNHNNLNLSASDYASHALQIFLASSPGFLIFFNIHVEKTGNPMDEAKDGKHDVCECVYVCEHVYIREPFIACQHTSIKFSTSQ